MRKAQVKAYAKINIGLNILGQTNDGYHLIDTVFASVNLFDTVTAEFCENENNIIVDGKSAGLLDSASKTVRAFSGIYGGCYKITVTKNIPYEAGLGGSSADIAGVLYALSLLTEKNFEDVKRIGAHLGSDVPFMMEGGLKRGRGKGEQLEPIDYKGEFFVLIVKPKEGVLTSKCYSYYDEYSTKTDCIEHIVNSFKSGLMPKYIENVLLNPAIKINPNIEPLYERMKKVTPLASLSGSGSAVFGLFSTKAELDFAYTRFSDCYYRYAGKFIDKALEGIVVGDPLQKVDNSADKNSAV